MSELMKQNFDLSDPRWWVPIYIPIVHDKRPVKILFGSRNSAKSHAIALTLMHRLLSEPTRLILVRKVYDTIKDSQWQTLKDVIEMHGPEVSSHFQFTVSPLGIKVSNGNMVLARGLDKPDKAKSVRDPNCVWFEELDQIEYEAYRDTVLSIRGSGRKEHFCSFNSPPSDHWIVEKLIPDYEEWEKPDGSHTYVRNDDPRHMILHTTYKHNPYADESFKDFLAHLKKTDYEEYRVQGLGLVGNSRTGEEFFANFDKYTHITEEKFNDPRFPYHLSFDFNNRPYATCLVFQIIGNKYKQIDEICPPPPNNTIEDIAKEFYSRYPKCRELFVYGDPTGRSASQRKSRSERRSYVDQIRHEFSRGWHNRSDRFIRKAPPLAGRRAAFREILTGRARVEYTIHNSCKNTILDFDKLKIANEGGYIKEKARDKNKNTYEKYGHCADALTYFFAFHQKKLF